MPAMKWIFLLSLSILICTSCKKLLTVPPPKNQVTAGQVFSSNIQASSAMAGLYVNLIGISAGTENFSNSLTSRLGALSSDELVTIFLGLNAGPALFNTNKLSAEGAAETLSVWTSLYATIYSANAIIDGITASRSSALTDSVRTHLTAEAKCIRAFCYFYLVNFFGDVPLVLVAEPLQVAGMSRTPVQKVYEQMIKDLKDAQSALPSDYAVSKGKRIRVNKWAATALLARVYLFVRDYTSAAAEAGKVINNAELYKLSTDLNTVFSTTSQEAIWQLAQNTTDGLCGNATMEGYTLLPFGTAGVAYYLSDQLLAAFEPGDLRREKWVDSIRFSLTGPPDQLYFYPYKYKTGQVNLVIGGTATEYYMLLRLAEQYLIRAEAKANGAPGGAAAAVADLNILRHRSGLPDLPGSLQDAALLDAVAKEWQTEMFTEWGHRWFNLKRTGKAKEVLSAISIKQPWDGDHQFLYPIPMESITNGSGMIQNPGY